MAWAQACPGAPVSLQVLGSGGPQPSHERASTAYLVRVGDAARVLVDIGGGAFLRFGQARAELSELSLLAISHLHADHVSDLPALLWLSHNRRSRPLPVSGPSGNDAAPPFREFLRRLFDERDGAFPLLGPVLGGAHRNTAGGVRLDVTEIDVTRRPATTVIERDGMVVRAQGVPHGQVPTLAYRVEIEGTSIVFGSDQNGTDPAFVTFAQGADVLVLHLAIGAPASTPVRASPAVVGQIARDAGARHLVVSHLGEFPVEAALNDVRRAYDRPVTVATDLQCVAVRR